MDFAILAGGMSERFGIEKSSMTFGSQSLLERTVETLRIFSDRILIVKKRNTEIPSIDGVIVVEDTSDERGAIIGVRTALLASREKCCFVFACDMPFLNSELIERMMGIEREYDALVPAHSKWIEPLHAVYSKKCINTIDECIRGGEKSIRSVLSMVKTEYIRADLFCNPEVAFFNINTREEYERAMKFSRKEEELCRSSEWQVR